MASEHAVANEDVHHDMCCIARPDIPSGDQEISFFVACEDDISDRHLHRTMLHCIAVVTDLHVGRAVPLSAVRGKFLLSCEGSDKDE
jgi:hypothetical protein